MTTKKKKNQKPINIDAHFKYRCPDDNCGYDHWVSLNEAKTLKFKIVCDCGQIFSPKTIAKLKIVYRTSKEHSQQIPIDTLEKCVKILTQYGFSNEESVKLINLGFVKCKETNAINLVRYVIKNFGELDVNN